MFKILDNMKYKDKNKLVKYDLYVDLFKEFNLKVLDIAPLRNVFFVFTDNGTKVLKKLDYDVERLEFIYTGVVYVKQNFNNIMDFVLTKEGDIYVIWNGSIYCILDLVDGRECEFGNPLDIPIAAQALGRFHNAGEGFKYNDRERNRVGQRKFIYERKLEELKFFKNIANMHEIKNEFDNLFLDNADYYISQAEECIKELAKSNYLKLCSEEDKIVLCHNDLAHHNIIINEGQAFFIDFDYAVIDLKISDLCNFINKAIKNYAFDVDKANRIVDNYCVFNSLNNREREVLKIFMKFPEDFYNISKDYYSRRKEWDEEVFIERIQKRTRFREERQEFLQKFLSVN